MDPSLQTVTLTTRAEDGSPLEATFLPEMGMTLASYKRGSIEVIAQSTKEDFEKFRSGLGVMIGPHFYERAPHLLPAIDHEFAHEKKMREKKKSDLFSHGVGRYAAWNVEANAHSIHAELSGKDQLEGIPLAVIEGQEFKMRFDASLTPQGLALDLSVVSENDSVVGFHYYYDIGKEGDARIRAAVQGTYLDNLDGNRKKTLPADWTVDAQRVLTYPLTQETDCTLYPYPNLLEGKVVLETKTHSLNIHTSSPSAENSWQIWHPQGASFACIEPISALNPRRPNLTVSQVSAVLTIIPHD